MEFECPTILDLDEAHGKVLPHEQSARLMVSVWQLSPIPLLNIAEINVMPHQCLSRRIDGISKLRDKLSA